MYLLITHTFKILLLFLKNFFLHFQYKTQQVHECLRKTVRKYILTKRLPLSEALLKNIEKTNGSLCPMDPCLPSVSIATITLACNVFKVKYIIADF